MRKQRKILSVILGLLCGMTVLNVVLFVLGVLSVLVFGLILGIQTIAIIALIWSIVVLTRKLKRKQLEKALEDLPLEKLEDDPTAIYKILGIPVRYDDTGRVLTIYELLGLKPLYDENGKRIKTIYEELEVNPSFDKNGVEKPTVVIIKNRVDKIAKVKSSSKITFTRKLTPEQRDQLIMLKLLREKKKEAEQNGDKEKIAKIDVAIKKVSEKKPEAKKPAAMKLAPAKGKAIKNPSYKAGKPFSREIFKKYPAANKKSNSVENKTGANSKAPSTMIIKDSSKYGYGVKFEKKEYSQEESEMIQ